MSDEDKRIKLHNAYADYEIYNSFLILIIMVLQLFILPHLSVLTRLVVSSIFVIYFILSLRFLLKVRRDDDIRESFKYPLHATLTILHLLSTLIIIFFLVIMLCFFNICLVIL